MTNVAYIVKESGITLFKDGKQFSAPSDHWSYDRILKKIKDSDFDKIEALFSAKEAVAIVQEEIVEGIKNQNINDVRIVDGEVFVGERKIYNSVSKRLLAMLKGGFDIKPLSNFLRRLLNNPSKTATEELYPFMEKADVAIDSEGFIIAYKKVRDDYYDIYSGTVNYNIGNIVEMPRNEVDDNRNNLCSDGLHFCSFSYLRCFGSAGASRVLIVKIDPADVVSVPADYNDAKARTCKMEVIGEIPEDKVELNILEKAPVVKNTASAPARVSTNVDTTGTLTILSQYFVQNQQISSVLSQKLGRAINVSSLLDIHDLDHLTLAQLSAVYNDIVSVYNVLDDTQRTPSVAIFKCAKQVAINKVVSISDKLVEWYEENKGN